MKLYLKNMKKKFPVLMLIPFVFGFFSCNDRSLVKSITEDDLFSLQYGNFEGEINLFGVNTIGNVNTSVTMKDGFFYIVNGQNQKILSFNSYGDLLSVYFNEDFYNEKYKGLASNSSAGVWKPVSYPFTFDGKITVDSKKYMYAVGIVPKDRNEQDEKDNLIYSQVVLRFASDGSVLDYIGQQGPSGTPFPFIRHIYTNSENELIVVCNTNEGILVFWFNSSGYLRYKIPVTIKDVPSISLDSLTSSINDVYISVENVVPDYSTRRLFVKVDYYVPSIDNDSKTQMGINYFETFVYPLDLSTGTYEKPLNIPPYEESVTENFGKITYKMPYDFLGVTKNGWMYFLISTDDGFAVELVDSDSQHVVKRVLPVNHEDVLFYSIDMSDEGIISAILAEKEKCRIVWWRTDSIIASILKS